MHKNETELREEIAQKWLPLLAAAKEVAEYCHLGGKNSSCHYGICEIGDCGRCQRAARLHAAIKECERTP